MNNMTSRSCRLCVALLFITLFVFQLSMPSAYSAVSAERATITPSEEHESARQAADILGLTAEFNQISSAASARNLSTPSRWNILGKVMAAVLQVQIAENRIEGEAAYAYDIITRDQRRTNRVNQAFTFANFTQFGTLYTLEPFFRTRGHFVASGICTSVGAGLGILLPTANILYNKTHKLDKFQPPSFLSEVINGDKVDGSHLPPLVEKYLQSAAPGMSVTRLQAMNEYWKQNYNADLERPETLCAINDTGPKNISIIHRRIVLLWSLYTAVQFFDRDLLCLLRECRTNNGVQLTTGENPPAQDSSLSAVVRVLKLQGTIKALKDPAVGDNRDLSLPRLQLLEGLLVGYLEMQNAADKCQHELNFQYDVVQSNLTARRNRVLQRTFETNFIQSGTFGAVAGLEYLKRSARTGNELFIVSSANGIAITTFGLLVRRAFKSKNVAPPNSLADLFELKTDVKDYGFSPVVNAYLDSIPPGAIYVGTTQSPQKTRRMILEESWSHVATLDLKKPSNLRDLSDMPGCKPNTIPLVADRIALLTSLRQSFGDFDSEILVTLKNTWPRQDSIKHAAIDASQQPTELLTRDILESFLEESVDSNLVSREIILESQILSRMARARDRIQQLTNVLNFYQIGVFGILADSLQLSATHLIAIDGDRVNIVSGLLVGSLGLIAQLEQRGGYRPNKVQPNALGELFPSLSANRQLTQFTSTYLTSHATNSTSGMTRKDDLIDYWKNSKVLNINISKPSTERKVAAQPPENWWAESIKLINNRVTMLYDLRAVIRTSAIELDRRLETAQSQI